MDSSDPVAIELVHAIHAGDTSTLERLLAQHPGLAARADPRRPRLEDTAARGRGLARLFSRRPGRGQDAHRRRCPPYASTGGDQPETPLHWAASSDDADVAEALIKGGADIEVPGGSIGTPLDNSIGYGCWHVARLLVASGARVDKLWHAAALGILPRLEELLAATPAPAAGDISEAFWQACHGGQRRAAELLLARGADIATTPGYSDQAPADVAAAISTRRENLVTWLRDHGARTAGQES